MTSVASSNLGYVTSATPMYVNEEKWDETRHALIEHFRARGVQLLIVKQEIHEPGTKAAGLDVPSASGAPSDEAALGIEEKEGQEQDANLTALLETAGLKPNEMDGDDLTAVLTALKEQGFAVNKTASAAPSQKESADVAQQATSMSQALTALGDSAFKNVRALRDLAAIMTLPEHFNEQDIAVQTQIWRIANAAIYATLKACVGYKHKALLADVASNDGLGAWLQLEQIHNTATTTSVLQQRRACNAAKWDTPGNPRHLREFADELTDIENKYKAAQKGAVKKGFPDEEWCARLLEEMPGRYRRVKGDIEKDDRDGAEITVAYIKAQVNAFENANKIWLTAQMARISSKRRAGRASLAEAKEEPPSPCKHCGGNHWNKDCPRRPQQPSGRGRASPKQKPTFFSLRATSSEVAK